MARHSCCHPFALVQTSWCELGPTTATGSSRFMAKHVFPLEKSRLHVLIRFSTHELIAQHMSKHQHFCLHLAFTLLSPPLCTKCCRQRVPAPRRNRSSSLRMGKRGTKTGKEMCTEEMAVPIPVAQSNHLTENSSLHLNLSP